MYGFGRTLCASASLAALIGAIDPACAGSERVVYAFGHKPHGRLPSSGLVRLGNAFYGVTSEGGTGNCQHGCGTIFRVTAGGRQTVIHQLSDNEGSFPLGGLVALNGVLYGTTGSGGTGFVGTIFSVTTAGVLTILHNFTGKDGEEPTTMIVQNGVLYGTTSGGGANFDGTAFSITPSGNFTNLHSFGAAGDGTTPQAPLTAYDGLLYGTTTGGGASGDGTVFSLTPDGTEKLLHSFSGADGSIPGSQLTRYGANLYATTSEGGLDGYGTVFSITPKGNIATLYNFTGESDGRYPGGNLLPFHNVLYGTAGGGGSQACPYGCGTIFSITPNGGFALLYSFQGGMDGAAPIGDLIDFKGTIYGLTIEGGGNTTGDEYGDGTVFAFTP